MFLACAGSPLSIRSFPEDAWGLLSDFDILNFSKLRGLALFFVSLLSLFSLRMIRLLAQRYQLPLNGKLQRSTSTP